MTRTEDLLTSALAARAEQVDALDPGRLPDAHRRRLTPGRVGALMAATAVASTALTAPAVATPDEKEETAVATAPVVAAEQTTSPARGERLERDLDGDGRDDAVILGADDVLTVELAGGGSPSTQLRSGSSLLGIARYDRQHAAVVRDGTDGPVLLKAVDGKRLVDAEPEGTLWLDLGDVRLRLEQGP